MNSMMNGFRLCLVKGLPYLSEREEEKEREKVNGINFSDSKIFPAF